MSIHEIEAAIIRLTPQQLLDLISCLQEYHDKAGEQPQEEDELEVKPFDAQGKKDSTPIYATAN